MLKQFIKEMLLRIVIIVTLIVLLHMLSYREGLKTYNSNTHSRGTVEILDLSQGFNDFIYEESLNDVLKDYSDKNTVGRISFPSLKIDLPVQHVQNISNLNNIDYWGNSNGFGVIRTKSNKETFGSGITYVEGNNFQQHMFASLKQYEDADFTEKNKVFFLKDSEGILTPYTIFSVTRDIQSKILKELRNDNQREALNNVFNLLKENTLYQIEEPYRFSDIVIVAVVSSGNDVLLIGGYHR